MIRSGTLPTFPAIATFIAGGIVMSAFAVIAMRTAATSTAPVLDERDLGGRVLVIAPHPDDEVLGAGGTIHRLVSSGARVRVVIVTAGDAYRRAATLQPGVTGTAAYLALGEIRHRESVAAAARLGLSPEDVASLGYSDGTTLAMWDQCWDVATTAVGRNGATSVPYPWAEEPGAPFNGVGLAHRLETEIREFRPDTVITPDVHETHPDHAMTATFAMYAMDAADFRGRRLSDVIHFRHYPYPWAHLPALALNPPPRLLQSDTEWLALPLRPEDEAAKSRGIAAYRSQTEIADMGMYMRAFIRTNELFASRAPADPAASASNARPAAGNAGTVAVTPRPVVAAPQASQRSRIESIRMVRAPRLLWIGLVCDRAPRSDDEFGVGLRLFGGGKPQRLDVTVRAGVATVPAAQTDSVTFEGIRAEADGPTMWIAVPLEPLTGRTRCMIGATVGLPATPPMRTAWREVDL